MAMLYETGNSRAPSRMLSWERALAVEVYFPGSGDHHPGCRRKFWRAGMPKLSDYVGMAATEYVQETGKDELDPRWIAAFFQDSGVLDAYPRQDLVAFAALVRKELTLRSERARKRTRFHLDKVVRLIRLPRKP